jgi:hypothetical protein
MFSGADAMRVTGGVTVQVYRGTADRHGDKDATLVATVPGCVWQPSTGLNLDYRPNDNFQETSSLTSILWIPQAADVRDRDRVKFNGGTFRVVGSPAWAGAHPVTRTKFSHKAVEIESLQ